MKSKFTLRIEEQKLKEMKITAINENMPLNELIEKIFNQYIEEKKADCQVA